MVKTRSINSKTKKSELRLPDSELKPWVLYKAPCENPILDPELDSWTRSHLSCMPMLRLCRKFPPNAMQSSEVKTAWIHPGERDGKQQQLNDSSLPPTLAHTRAHANFSDQTAAVPTFAAVGC